MKCAQYHYGYHIIAFLVHSNSDFSYTVSYDKKLIRGANLARFCPSNDLGSHKSFGYSEIDFLLGRGP